MTSPDPDLAEAERLFRMLPDDPYPGGLAHCSRLVLAEYDARARRIADVLAYLDKVEEDSEMFRRTHGGGLMPAIVEVSKIRELLGGEQGGN